MAYIAVEHPDGTSGIGSAFHVGEGVFVTARHVVDGLRIREIATTERSYIDAEDSRRPALQFPLRMAPCDPCIWLPLQHWRSSPAPIST
jgi:hypothetical protein